MTMEDLQRFRKNPRAIQGGLKPVTPARSDTSEAIKQIQQAVELCMVVDKDRSGQI